MSIILTALPEHQVAFTPITDPLVTGGPFAQVKRDYPDFQALMAAYATFQALKDATD